jgi:hypothetical protein
MPMRQACAVQVGGVVTVASKQASKQALGFPGWLLVKVMGMYAVKVLRAL